MFRPVLKLLWLGDDDGDVHSTKSKKTPPLHPRQKFKQLCRRVSSNEVTSLSLRDEWVDISLLSRSLAATNCLKELELQLLESVGTDWNVFCDVGLGHNQCLQRLSLEGSCMSSSHVHHLARALSSHPAVKQLSLARCQIGNASLNALACVSKLSSLEELNLSDNSISSGSTVASIVLTNSLKSLHLHCTCLGAWGLAIMAEEGCFRSLKTLDVSKNNITPEPTPLQAVAFELSLATCTLQELQLDENSVTDSGVLMLASALSINTSLRSLSLCQCQIGDAGTHSLATALRENAHSQLRTLKLDQNAITENGAQALLEGCTSLRRIDLLGNSISNGSGLLEIIKSQCTTLHALDLKRNKLPRQLLLELQFLVRANATGGRRLLAGDSESVPSVLWAEVLGRAASQPDVLYYLLLEHPAVCGCISR